jgi:hypothetical protein
MFVVIVVIEEEEEEKKHNLSRGRGMSERVRGGS